MWRIDKNRANTPSLWSINVARVNYPSKSGWPIGNNMRLLNDFLLIISHLEKQMDQIYSRIAEITVKTIDNILSDESSSKMFKANITKLVEQLCDEKEISVGRKIKKSFRGTRDFIGQFHEKMFGNDKSITPSRVMRKFFGGTFSTISTDLVL